MISKQAMGASGGWSRRSLSACYLMSCTVILMVVLFATEDFLFPARCRNCVIHISSGAHRTQDSLGDLWSSVVHKPQSLVKVPNVDSVDKNWEDLEIRDSQVVDDNSQVVELELEKLDLGSNDTLEVGGRELESVDLESTKNTFEVKSDDESFHLERKLESEIETLRSKTQVAKNSEVPTEIKEDQEALELEKEPEPKIEERRNTTEVIVAEDVAIDIKEVRHEEKSSVPEVVNSTVEDPSMKASIPPLNAGSLVYYYTHLFKFPDAVLRKLTAEDGAAPLRSSTQPREREITIATQTSADRLHAVETSCMTWGGAMSVAVHVRLESDIGDVYSLLKEMHARVERNDGCRLDIQVVTEDGFDSEEEAIHALYPVNALRNVALSMVTTKLVFLLDADFKPNPGLHEYLTEEGFYQELLRNATESRQLYVVPAFEITGTRGRAPQNITVPVTMEDLKERWSLRGSLGGIDCFHCQKSPSGHMPTIFDKFFDPATTTPYSIPYRDGFEPYVIGALDAIPLYDARFRGYGENKVSHLYACAADGMGFQVLPHSFVVELPHRPSSARETYLGKHRDPDQRYRIVGLYRQFKNEIAKKQSKKDKIKFHQFLQMGGLIKKNPWL